MADSLEHAPEHTPAGGLVAVTGATGFVGRHVVRELRRRGRRVRALARDAAKAGRVLPEDGVELVVGDALDTGAMDRLAEGADALVHLVGIRREASGGATYEKMHVGATRSAIGAASRAGVARYLHMSALGARPEAATAYHRTKWRAEEIVRDSGLAWTILRPSLILGAGGEFMDMAIGWARGTEPPRRFLPYFSKPTPTVRARARDTGDPAALVQPVSVTGVAQACVEAGEREQAIGEIYPLVGSEVCSWPELLVMVRDATPGAKKNLEPHGVPGVLAARLAWALGRVGLGSLLPFGPSEPIMAIEDNTGGSAKALTDLGVEPEPLARILAASVAA